MKITRAAHPPARRRSGRAPVAVAVAAALAATALGTGAAQADAGLDSAAGGAGVACPGLPRGLALIGNGPHNVLRVTRSRTASVAGVRRGVITKAVRGRDGTMWVEARPGGRPNGEWRRIVRIVPDGGRQVSETGDVELSHVGTVGDQGRATVATYIDRDRTPGVPPDDDFGGVYVEFSSGARRSLGPAGAPESSSVNAAPAVRRVGHEGSRASLYACRSPTSPRRSSSIGCAAASSAACSTPPTTRPTTCRPCS